MLPHGAFIVPKYTGCPGLTGGPLRTVLYGVVGTTHTLLALQTRRFGFVLLTANALPTIVNTATAVNINLHFFIIMTFRAKHVAYSAKAVGLPIFQESYTE